MPPAVVLLCPDEDRFHLAGALSIHNPNLAVAARPLPHVAAVSLTLRGRRFTLAD